MLAIEILWGVSGECQGIEYMYMEPWKEKGGERGRKGNECNTVAMERGRKTGETQVQHKRKEKQRVQRATSLLTKPVGSAWRCNI